MESKENIEEIKRIQKYLGLTEDGIIGINTLILMHEYKKKRLNLEMNRLILY